MSEYELLLDVKTRHAAQLKRLATNPGDPDILRILSDLEADEERLEVKLGLKQVAVPVVASETKPEASTVVETEPVVTEEVKEPGTEEEHKEDEGEVSTKSTSRRKQ